MANVYIGTSGWMYRDWSFDYAQDKQNYFYPSKLPQRKWLEYFSRHFKTVEVNSTFYRQMKPAIFENWSQAVSNDFIFSIKASRFITHVKRLKDCRDSLKIMMESAAGLGKKLGPILFQCPPRFKADRERLEEFLSLAKKIAGPVASFLPVSARSGQKPNRWKNDRAQLRAAGNPSSGATRNFLSSVRFAFEFREPSWFDESIYEILRKYNAALVLAESGGYWPNEELLTADFVYVRFHGEGGSYASKYTDKELEIWAKKIKKWQRAGVDVYTYFNNDVGGFAVENAKTLINLVR